MDRKKRRVEIWGDVIEIASLIRSIIISGTFTMGAYFLAPRNDQAKELFFGLMGAILAFIIIVLAIKPKRLIILEEERENR